MEYQPPFGFLPKHTYKKKYNNNNNNNIQRICGGGRGKGFEKIK